MTDAIAELRVAKSAALKAYNEDVKNGITAKGQGFPKWCEQNDPSIKALEETMRTKSALFDACQNGDGVASNLNTFRNRVNDAALGAGQNPGLVREDRKPQHCQPTLPLLTQMKYLHAMLPRTDWRHRSQDPHAAWPAEASDRPGA